MSSKVVIYQIENLKFFLKKNRFTHWSGFIKNM